MGFWNTHIYGDLKYGVEEQFPQLSTELQEQFQQTNCAEWENSWWSGREDKDTENTERMGEIPRNSSHFRGAEWIRSLPSQPSSELGLNSSDLMLNIYLWEVFKREPLISLQDKASTILTSFK